MSVERRSLADRFAELVDRRAADECWIWTGPRRRRGYGAINEGGTGGRTLVASRVAWELAHGKSIPEGMIVRHSCDNPPCVNPAHLLLGTHADNSRDRVDRGRHVRGVDHPRARLTEQQVIEIVGLLAQHVNQHEIAERFGISQALVSGIRRGTHWSHIARPTETAAA